MAGQSKGDYARSAAVTRKGSLITAITSRPSRIDYTEPASVKSVALPSDVSKFRIDIIDWGPMSNTASA
jgi:hypothetical protein